MESSFVSGESQRNDDYKATVPDPIDPMSLLTEEEFQKFKMCQESIPFLLHPCIGILGGTLSMGAVSGFVAKPHIKWFGLVGGLVSLITSKMYTGIMCLRRAAPVLFEPNQQDLYRARLEGRRQELSASQIQEDNSSILTSALEFDDPVSSIDSFSGDSSSLETDLTLPSREESQVAKQKEPVTYEELRKKHREEYIKGVQTRQPEKVWERSPGTSERSGRTITKRNKYGDEME